MSKERFIVDLARCTGCQACTIACKDRGELPDDLGWLRVEAVEGGSYPAPTLYYRAMHCFHCTEPPCADACPAAAVARHENQWVQIDPETCNGCGACLDACPFTVIVMGPSGVASKCDGCADEVSRGWGPTCVRACPMRALGYGSAHSMLLEKRVKDREFEEHGIGPAVLYLRR